MISLNSIQMVKTKIGWLNPLYILTYHPLVSAALFILDFQDFFIFDY